MTTDETCLAARQRLSRMRDRIDDDAALGLALEGMIAVDEAHFPERATYAAMALIDGAQRASVAAPAGWTPSLPSA
ncbi:hypothetical protein [Xanthomonas graminis]|uniref:hypothetical protein n=1 Tax=Xanthomonas graminis TaxID=3390026 RepID=UPI0011874EBD|nr:hypothetical protein [Xanthomonas translucens]UKE65859.1 hypothetical protein KM547_00230 [Xanthomonas translucens pv. phlei]UKE73477.1 hypothetical protein KFS85_00405 [Xanthomonas translucens pv. phleipratensis]